MLEEARKAIDKPEESRSAVLQTIHKRRFSRDTLIASSTIKFLCVSLFTRFHRRSRASDAPDIPKGAPFVYLSLCGCVCDCVSSLDSFFFSSFFALLILGVRTCRCGYDRNRGNIPMFSTISDACVIYNVYVHVYSIDNHASRVMTILSLSLSLSLSLVRARAHAL